MRTIRLSRWKAPTSALWLKENEIHADPLADLNTKNNIFSLWIIENESSKNLIATAIAATRDHLGPLDYMLFDREILTEFDVSLEETSGETSDESINKYHINAMELSAQAVLQIATALLSEGKPDRIGFREIGRMLAEALTSERIEIDKLSDSLVSDLNDYV